MSARKILTAVAVLTLVVGGWLLKPTIGRWLVERKISPEARAFWESFRATNAAWLDPRPASMTYELVLQRKERDFAKAKEYWVDSSVLRTWCTPEKNVRFVEEHLDRPATNYHFSEHRYFHGRGGPVSLEPSGHQRTLSPALWLAGRTGAGFTSILHLMSAWGLHPTATVERQPGGKILFSATNLLSTIAHRWQWDGRVNPAYGLHPAAWGSQTELNPERIEVRVNAINMLPETIEEKDDQGKTLAKIVFEEPWLELAGRPVPRMIRCEMGTPTFNLRYEFQVADGVWLLKEYERTYASIDSLCQRSFTRALKLGALPDQLFPGPADLEVPEHSVTSLAPGERMVAVRTGDGLLLEAKLSLPPASSGPSPVVFFLPGAGPWSFDRPLVYPDLDRPNEMFPRMKVYNYCDFFARELTARGIGFFRMNKRGCGIVRDEQGFPREIVNRSIFSQATPSVLLADYRAALQALRRESGVDPERIILLGGSEGTRQAPRLALAEPAGVKAVVMFGYAEDNTHETILWQQTVGPWRNIAKIFDGNGDQKVTRHEYDEVVRLKGKIVSDTLPFERLDRNGNGIITPAELNQRASAEAIFKAVQQREDDYLYDHVVCLSSAYLLEDWEALPMHQTLLQLNLPLGIFHGENDGSCRVEGARDAAKAFAKAGKTNLTVRTYPKTDHDLNWASILKTGKTPEGLVELLDFIEQQANTKTNVLKRMEHRR